MFINTVTLEYPISETQIRQLFPNTSFSSQFNPPSPYAPVFGIPEPVYNPDSQRIEQTTPVMRNGKWEQAWKVVELSADQKTTKQQQKYLSASQTIRSDRNALLRDSDWTQLADTPGQIRAAYVAYRQALRDLPSQPGFPWEVTWPQQPA